MQLDERNEHPHEDHLIVQLIKSENNFFFTLAILRKGTNSYEYYFAFNAKILDCSFVLSFTTADWYNHRSTNVLW